MYLYLGTRNCLPFASTCFFCGVRVAHLFRFMCCGFYLFVIFFRFTVPGYSIGILSLFFEKFYSNGLPIRLYICFFCIEINVYIFPDIYINACICFPDIDISLDSSEAACRRMIDNAMAEGNRTNGQTTIYKTHHSQLNIEQHEIHKKNGGEPVCSGMVSSPSSKLCFKPTV
jgi:hypothetical protein